LKDAKHIAFGIQKVALPADTWHSKLRQPDSPTDFHNQHMSMGLYKLRLVTPRHPSIEFFDRINAEFILEPAQRGWLNFTTRLFLSADSNRSSSCIATPTTSKIRPLT
jgi:hypothetical protein